MKRTLLILLLLAPLFSFSQAWIGAVDYTAFVNLRDSCHRLSPITAKIDSGEQVYVFSQTPINNYWHVIYIRENKEGYIHFKYLRFIQNVKANKSGFFQDAGVTEDNTTEIDINNDTKYTLTLKIGSKYYSFPPYQVKRISTDAGTNNYYASAPGVLPSYGTEYFKEGHSYKWRFYITTTYR